MKHDCMCVHSSHILYSSAEGQLGDNLMTSQPESGLLSLPNSRPVRHSLHAKPARERKRERARAGSREGGQAEEVGREGGERGVKAPGGCLGSFSGGDWDLGQGSTKVGEFLIRIGRDRGRRGNGGERL